MTSQGNDSSKGSSNTGAREGYNIGSRERDNTGSRECSKCDHRVRKCVSKRSMISLPIMYFPRESVIVVHMELGNLHWSLKRELFETV